MAAGKLYLEYDNIYLHQMVVSNSGDWHKYIIVACLV